MLSRVAESLWWLSRNVERAETLARILDVNYARTMDANRDVLRHWQGVLEVVGMQTDLEATASSNIPATALEYCIFGPENSTSLISCIRIARQNALHVRAELSTEVWEAVNGLYLFVDNSSPNSLVREGPSAFLRHVRDVAQALGGIIDATLLHDEAWDFLHMGHFFERAQLTTRIMRMFQDDDPFAETQTLLQMCCAAEPFAKIPHALAEDDRVISFLLLDAVFPRSVRFAIHEVDASLHRISGTSVGSFSNEAERMVGRMLGMLDFVQVIEIAGEGAPEFSARVTDQLGKLANAIQDIYFPSIPVR